MGKGQNSLFSSDLALLSTQLLEHSGIRNLSFEKCGLSYACQKFSVNLIFMMFLF